LRRSHRRVITPFYHPSVFLVGGKKRERLSFLFKKEAVILSMLGADGTSVLDLL
jgi:hypothetical protein